MKSINSAMIEVKAPTGMSVTAISTEGRATNPIDAATTPVLLSIAGLKVVPTTARPRIADLATTAGPTDRAVTAGDPTTADLTPALIRIADPMVIDVDRMTAAGPTDRAVTAGDPTTADLTPALIRIVDPMVIDADRMTAADPTDRAVTAGDPIDADPTPALIRIADPMVIDVVPTVVRATAADQMTGAGPMNAATIAGDPTDRAQMAEDRRASAVRAAAQTDPAAKDVVPTAHAKGAVGLATVQSTEAENGAAQMNRSPTAVPNVPRQTAPGMNLRRRARHAKKARRQPAPQ